MALRDDYYECDERINPHYGHLLQVWGDGAWQCVDCEGYSCVSCHREDVAEENGQCSECVSEQATYYVPDEGGQS